MGSRLRKEAAGALVLLFLAAVHGMAQERVSVANGRVSFDLPAGFHAMTAEEVALKYPSGNPPQYAYANDRWSVSIAITLSQSALAPEQLNQYKTAMEQMLPRLIPGLQWITREVVRLNGTPWVHLELRSLAIDTDIHNHMYMTSLDGRMLGFNFNSTQSEYSSVRDSLARSRASIRISD